MRYLTLPIAFIYMAIHVTLFSSSCTSDELPPPEILASCDTINAAYNSKVKNIIDNSCAYAGCHLPGGIGTGDYSSYSKLLPFLTTGSFENRVVNQKGDPSLGMPPNKSVYQESQKDDLTEQEFAIIQCWIADGFPEN